MAAGGGPRSFGPVGCIGGNPSLRLPRRRKRGWPVRSSGLLWPARVSVAVTTSHFRVVHSIRTPNLRVFDARSTSARTRLRSARLEKCVRRRRVRAWRDSTREMRFEQHGDCVVNETRCVSIEPRGTVEPEIAAGPHAHTHLCVEKPYIHIMYRFYIALMMCGEHYLLELDHTSAYTWSPDISIW